MLDVCMLTRTYTNTQSTQVPPSFPSLFRTTSNGKLGGATHDPPRQHFIGLLVSWGVVKNLIPEGNRRVCVQCSVLTKYCNITPYNQWQAGDTRRGFYHSKSSAVWLSQLSSGKGWPHSFSNRLSYLNI